MYRGLMNTSPCIVLIKSGEGFNLRGSSHLSEGCNLDYGMEMQQRERNGRV